MALFKISIFLMMLSLLSGCSFPEPGPGRTKLDVDVNSSEWATMSAGTQQAVIEGYEDEDPSPSVLPY